jgi:hypothetical protein
VFRPPAHCFGLCSGELTPWMHEVCSPSWQKMHAVGVGERHDNEITGLERANVGFDDADRLVSHDTTAIGVFHRLVWPEIAAADAGAGDSDDRVGWLDKAGVGDVFDTNAPAPNMTVARMVIYLRFSPDSVAPVMTMTFASMLSRRNSLGGGTVARQSLHHER